jgi:hypothetical protein
MIATNCAILKKGAHTTQDLLRFGRMTARRGQLVAVDFEWTDQVTAPGGMPCRVDCMGDLVTLNAVCRCVGGQKVK